jgi:hypothetical protein
MGPGVTRRRVGVVAGYVVLLDAVGDCADGGGHTVVCVYADRQGRSRLEERVIPLDGELAAPPAEPLKSAALLATLGARRL